MLSKRGQGAAGAAVLLAIILGVIIMFIVLIPPGERADLLDDEDDDSSTTSVDDDDDDGFTVKKNLLTVSPGRIDYLGQLEMEHPLPVINIYTRTESEIIAEKNVAYTKNGVFSDEESVFSFNVDDVENTENLLLSFKVKKSRGRLIVTLNGEQVFNADVGNTLPPITLPRNLIRPENQILFKMASPGIAFWINNEASLENIKVVADITTTEAQTSKSIFLISDTEYRNLERVILQFQPDCAYDQVGKLVIEVNGNELYNAVPECDLAMVPIEFSPQYIHQGENEVIFRTEKGTYILSHVMIESKLKEIDFPTYYFDLSHEEYEDVQQDNRRVRLEMDFVDVVSTKYGEVVFNSHIRHFDTKETTEVIDLSRDVVQGNNALKIRPKKTIEVRELKIDLVK